jgi:hypothetical protein
MNRRPGSSPKDRFVYFVSDGHDRIKIGITDHPTRRFAALGGCIYPLYCGKGNEALERKLHARFARYRLHHEWFRQSPELENFIRDLQHCEGHPYCPKFTFEEVREMEDGFRRATA